MLLAEAAVLSTDKRFSRIRNFPVATDPPQNTKLCPPQMFTCFPIKLLASILFSGGRPVKRSAARVGGELSNFLRYGDYPNVLVNIFQFWKIFGILVKF